MGNIVLIKYKPSQNNMANIVLNITSYEIQTLTNPHI